MRELRNLLPNPKPTDTSAWKFYSQKDLRVQMLSDNRLYITNNANIPDSYIYTNINLPAGSYRYGAEVSNPQGAFASNQLRVVALKPIQELVKTQWDGVAGRIVTPRFDLSEARPMELRVMVGPNTNCAIWVRHLFVMSEEDYQHMVNDNIAWFDGDGIVRGGFLLTVFIHMWIAAVLWWWSHEPGATEFGDRSERAQGPLPVGRSDCDERGRPPLYLYRQGQLVHGLMHVEYRDYGPGGACDCPDRTDRAHGVCELVDLGGGRTTRHTGRRHVCQGIAGHGNRSSARVDDQHVHDRCDDPRQRTLHTRRLGAGAHTVPTWSVAIPVVRRRHSPLTAPSLVTPRLGVAA